MIDNKKVHSDFKSELSQLLRKHNAKIAIADTGTYWMPSIGVVVKFEAIDNKRYFSQIVLK